MNETPDCDRIRPSLAEVAAGAVTGEDRARALSHVASCAACRRELTELARVADELLLLAPQREPPADFESAVMRRILSTTGGVRRWRHLGVARAWAGRALRTPGRTARARARSMAGAGRPPRAGAGGRPPGPRALVRVCVGVLALLLATAAGAAGAWWRTAPDRQLAEEYRHTLSVANGRSLTAAPVTAQSGDVVGQVFVYQGSPSWIMVALTGAPEPGDYTMWLVTAGGTRYVAGVCRVTGTSGTAGYALPIPVSGVVGIEFTRPGIRLSVSLA